MRCARCGHVNGPSARFCADCGAVLVRRCNACAAALPDAARFCPACGAPAAPAAPVPAPRPAERRQAAVLFADLAGYTALCTRLDAESVQALLERFFAAVDGTVAAYGGVVIDHAGDGVLAVFGAPVAHGNDAERALRAALDMHTAGARLAEPDTGRALALHVGVAAGEVVAAVLEGGATPKYTVTGEAVNLAARLGAQAAAGETLVAPAVQRAVAALVEADDLGERALKGFAAPVRAWRVRGLRAAAQARWPFVGRLAELRQIDGVLDGLREAGAALLVRGDPGIGKSRLVEELARRAEARGCAVHVAKVLDFGVAKGQEALPAIVAALLGLAPEAGDDERGAALAAALVAGRVPPAHESMLADLLGLAQRAELQPLFEAMDNATRLARSAEALAQLATRAAREQPRVLAIEDIHWAPPPLLACLAALTQATRAAPLVLAMTTRFEGDPIDRAWRAASHGTPLLSIDMGPLTLQESRRLAGRMMAASERYALQCIERAEGNPLFLEQLLRNALEGEAAQVPPTIQSLVLARIDRLAPRDKQALQAASVLGKRVDPQALAGLLDDAAYRCDALLAADLLRPEGGDFLFAHALIHEGVYASLLNARKRELHLRAAEGYRGREPALFAEHLDRAGHPDAAAACLAAAHDEAQRLRHDAALRLAARSAALGAGSALGCAGDLLAGELLARLARTGESVAAFERARAAAADDAQRCRAWLGSAAAHRVTGDVAAGLAALDAAQPLAQRLGDDGALARIHNLRGNFAFALGRSDECGRAHARALEHAERAGDLEMQAGALSGLGDQAYAEGRMVTALGHFRRCVELCRRSGAVRSEIVNTCMVGHCLNWTGEGDAGLAEVRRAAELSARVGVPQTDVMALESVAMVLTLRGDHAEAESALERAIAAAGQASSRRFLSVNLLLLAQCRLHAGRRAEARTLLGEALQIARETGIGFIGPGIVSALALAAEEAGERRRWLDEGEVLLAGECVLHARMMFHRDAIDVALDDGCFDEALRQAERLEACARLEPMSMAQLGAVRARALVRLARDGRSAALDAELSELATQLRRAGMGAMALRLDAAQAAA